MNDKTRADNRAINPNFRFAPEPAPKGPTKAGTWLFGAAFWGGMFWLVPGGGVKRGLTTLADRGWVNDIAGTLLALAILVALGLIVREAKGQRCARDKAWVIALGVGAILIGLAWLGGVSQQGCAHFGTCR